MHRKLSATDARIHFGEVMRDVVEKQEPVIVERSGKPHIVVMSVDQYERLLAERPGQIDWRELVDRAREEVEADLEGRDLTPPADILRESRERRDEQLADLR